MSSLRDVYLEAHRSRMIVLNEGILDLLDTNPQNVQKVKAALQGTKAVAQTYGMKNILTAVTKAEQSFETSLTDKKAKNRAQVISSITTFSDVMSDFFREMDSWIMQLPSMTQALEQSKVPENANKTLRDLLGQGATQIAQIVQKQFYKSGNGFLKTLGRFFTPGMKVDANSALASFGIDSQKVAEDILGIKASQYTQVVQSGKGVQPVQLNTTTTTPTNTEQPTNTAAGAQTAGTTPEAPAASTAPATGAAPTTQPNATDVQKRNASLTALKNQNAFVPGEIAKLSNDEIKTELQQIAKQLGITLA